MSGGAEFGASTKIAPGGRNDGRGRADDYAGGGDGEDDDDDDDVVEPDRGSEDEMDEHIMAYGDLQEEVRC